MVVLWWCLVIAAVILSSAFVIWLVFDLLYPNRARRG